MEKVKLQGTSLEVSRLCLGAMTFGKQASEAESIRMVETAIDGGLNFFDTANVYNSGASEILLGRALGSKRRHVVVASKVRGKMGPRPDDVGLSKQAIHKALDESLHRLNTDYLDLYYLHNPDYGVPIEETLETMDSLVKSGKVRYVASSNYAAWQVAQCRAIAAGKGYQPIHVTQPMYNLIARGIEQEFLPMCKAYGISTFVYNPLAGGLLTGKQRQERPLPGTRFDGNQQYLERYWHQQSFTAVADLKRIAVHARRSLVGLSLGWLLHHTEATGIILGASGKEQLVANLKEASLGPLKDETVVQCNLVWERLRGVVPKYNR